MTSTAPTQVINLTDICWTVEEKLSENGPVRFTSNTRRTLASDVNAFGLDLALCWYSILKSCYSYLRPKRQTANSDAERVSQEIMIICAVSFRMRLGGKKAWIRR